VDRNYNVTTDSNAAYISHAKFLSDPIIGTNPHVMVAALLCIWELPG